LRRRAAPWSRTSASRPRRLGGIGRFPDTGLAAPLIRRETGRVPGLRVAALVVGLSVASDFGRGLDDGQALRSCLGAQRIAEVVDLPSADRAALYWLTLLRFVGCTATATEMAAALGNELAVSAAFAAVDPRDLRAVLRAAVTVTGGRPDRVARLLARAPGTIREHETASCEVAQLIGDRLGLGGAVRVALGQVFERWDGRGHPGVASGEQLEPATRVWQLAHLADLLSRDAGWPTAQVARELRRRAGAALAPDVASRCAQEIELVCQPVAADADAVLAAEPEPHLTVSGDAVDGVLELFGMLGDLKAPCFVGHNGRVAELAADAAAGAGCTASEVVALRRAGLVQDVGRVAVSSAIWNKREPLSTAEREQIRLHPYHSQRVLGRVPELAAISELAAGHHERADGSGYHRGLFGAAFSFSHATLAAAECWVATGEDRPYRPAHDVADRRRLLRAEAVDGRLPASAVDAVLAAAEGWPGYRPPRGRARAALTEREGEVLAAIATGLTNQAVARRLGISPKTVNTHLEHVYAKLGVSTRAAAVVHAITAGLLDTPRPAPR
jgi:HD-GYP domain-containing protein (c-di-GMP phosphodiesterase class II)